MLNKKTIVKAVVLGVSSLVAVSSFAATQGTYVGGQLGWGDVHQSIQASSVSGYGINTKTSSKDTGIAGRLFAGYQFDSNWAAELGWNKFSDADAKATSAGKVIGLPYSYNAKATIKTDAIDLVAKGIYPVANNVNVYGKAGVAYVMSRYEEKATSTLAGRNSYGRVNDKESKLFPTFGAGVSYDFTQNVAADLSYNRIQKTGSSSKINSTDLVSVGLIYSIG